MSASGFLINPAYSFLGASPDGAVYDPSSVQQPFGFVEIKCPYSHRHTSPAEACNTSSFAVSLIPPLDTSSLKESHRYYTQVQGQMAIGERPWCDFVILKKD